MQIITKILKNSDYWSIHYSWQIPHSLNPTSWAWRAFCTSFLFKYFSVIPSPQTSSFFSACCKQREDEESNSQLKSTWRKCCNLKDKIYIQFFKCCSIKYKHMVILTNKLQIELSYRRTIRFNETMHLNIIKKPNI